MQCPTGYAFGGQLLRFGGNQPGGRSAKGTNQWTSEALGAVSFCRLPAPLRVATLEKPDVVEREASGPDPNLDPNAGPVGRLTKDIRNIAIIAHVDHGKTGTRVSWGFSTEKAHEN